MKPPLLPTEVLRRVLRVAKFDGMSVLGVAGAFALVSAASRDVPGAVVGLLVAGAGAIELHGVTLLNTGRAGGLRWLVGSQVYLMAVMLIYVGISIQNPDVSWMRPLVTPELSEQIRQTGMTVEESLLNCMRLIYVIVGAATLLYQGGMTIYYLRRRVAVESAVEELELP